MGYMLPIRFIKVSVKPSVVVCATRIVAMMSTDIYQARRMIHDEKKSGGLINACGTAAAKTAIILDNGNVISSPLTISALLKYLEKSNIKASVKKNSVRMKVYDVFDEEPSPEIDELVSEISGVDDEEEKEEYFEDEDEMLDE